MLNRLDTGGTERTVLRVIQGLDSDGMEHQICATRGFNPDWVEKHNLTGRLRLAGDANQRFQFLLPSLVRIMKEYRPHIVHSRNWGAIEAVLSARFARVPVVIHSEHGYELDMLQGLPLRRRLLRKACYAMASAVFTVSDQLREYHSAQAWVAGGKIRVIRNGIDMRLFAPQPEMRQEMRTRLGFNAETVVIGSVGRMVSIKDYGTLLKALEIVLQHGMDIHVLLAGAGPELETHRKYVAASTVLANRVLFTGASDHVETLLNAMDVFVLPSIAEGMSNTIVEAMACGLPVLATNVGGNQELIENGVSGLLFRVGDVNGLAKQLEVLSANPELRHSLGSAARQQAVERFSLEGMIANYRSLYVGLAHERGVPSAARS